MLFAQGKHEDARMSVFAQFSNHHMSFGNSLLKVIKLIPGEPLFLYVLFFPFFFCFFKLHHASSLT